MADDIQNFENVNEVDTKMTAVDTKAKIDNCLPFPEMETLRRAKILKEFAKMEILKIERKMELLDKGRTGLFGVRSSSDVSILSQGPKRKILVLAVLVILVLVTVYYLKTKKTTLSRQTIPDIEAIKTRGGGSVKIKNASLNSALFRHQAVSNGNTLIKVKMKRIIFYKAMNRLRIISVIWLIIATVLFGSIGTLSSNSRQPNSTYALMNRRIRNIEIQNQSFNQNQITEEIEQFLNKTILINETECTGEKTVNIVKDVEKSNITRTKKNRKPEKRWNTKIHTIRDLKTDFANESENLGINSPPTIVRNRIKTT